MTAGAAGSAIGTSRIERLHVRRRKQPHDNIFDGVMSGECPHDETGIARFTFGRTFTFTSTR
jgi:hypothetical protein